VLSSSRAWAPVAAIVLAVLLWSSSFIALKIAFRHYDPMVVIFGRMAIATLCFGFLVRRMGHIQLRRGDLKFIVFMCLCEPCLYFIFEAKALQNTTASQAGLITAILPLLVAVAAGLFLKERISRRTIVGFLVAIAGACWLSLEGDATAEAPNPALGNFFEFLAMVCATGYMVTMKYLAARLSALFITGMQAAVGGLFYLPLLFLPGTRLPTSFEPLSAFALVYLGVFITLGAYGLYNFGASRIPASQASAFVNLIPVFSIFLGWLVLGETFTPPQLAASALVFIGIVISRDRPGTRRLAAAAG
jgi:drug/metabolite transporter (DMT)-like permease